MEIANWAFGRVHLPNAAPSQNSKWLSRNMPPLSLLPSMSYVTFSRNNKKKNTGCKCGLKIYSKLLKCKIFKCWLICFKFNTIFLLSVDLCVTLLHQNLTPPQEQHNHF